MDYAPAAVPPAAPQHHPAVFIITPPVPPFPPDSSRSSVVLSPVEFVLGLIAVITIPALIYTIVFAIRCPPSSSSSSSASPSFPRHLPSRGSGRFPFANDGVDASATDANKFGRESSDGAKDSGTTGGGGECPVCLSAFAGAEEVKRLAACKHAFHAGCIDRWLESHSSCPVCRAPVAVKGPARTTSSAMGRRRNADLHEGLPDAANLV